MTTRTRRTRSPVRSEHAAPRVSAPQRGADAARRTSVARAVGTRRGADAARRASVIRTVGARRGADAARRASVVRTVAARRAARAAPPTPAAPPTRTAAPLRPGPAFEAQRRRWQERYAAARERAGLHPFTISGIPIQPIYTPADLAGMDLARDLGFPGEYPYTRGVHDSMYRGRLFTMRQFSGFGLARESNQR